MKAQISALRNPEKRNLPGGLSEDDYKTRIRELEGLAPTSIPILSIVIRPPFSELFPLHDSTYDSVFLRIRSDGYDPRFPILVWKEGPAHVLIDGHRRLTAAKEVGLETIPALVCRFDTQEEAYGYAVHIQFDRRNIDSRGILVFLSTHGIDSAVALVPGAGRTREKIARLCNISEATAGRIITVLNKAPKDMLAEIYSGTLSVIDAFTHLSPPKPIVEDPPSKVPTAPNDGQKNIDEQGRADSEEEIPTAEPDRSSSNTKPDREKKRPPEPEQSPPSSVISATILAAFRDLASTVATSTVLDEDRNSLLSKLGSFLSILRVENRLSEEEFQLLK